MACIPPQVTKVLKKALQDGKINVDNLLTKTPDERMAELLKYMDEKQAKNVDNFIVRKYKTNLSDDLVEEIFIKQDKIKKLRGDAPVFKNATEWSASTESQKWAKEYVALNRKIEEALDPTANLGFIDTIKVGAKDIKANIASKPTIGGKALEATKTAADLLTSSAYKSIKASLDMSYALRQGFKILTKDLTEKVQGRSSKAWSDSFKEGWKVISSIKSKKAMDAVMDEWKARYLAHPHYDVLVNQGKLAFGAVEDFFPTTIAQKIPIMDNAFKASDEAFTMFSQTARFSLASDMMEKAMINKGGQSLTKEEVKAIAQFANSITGRGSLGKLEAQSQALNKLFFSARFMRSQVDTFIMPFNPKVSPFVRAEATKHMIATLGAVGAIIGTASMFNEVETDPRSTNFGKMKIGKNTWVDLTAGLGQYVRLAYQQAVGEKKTSSGKVQQLDGKGINEGREDVLLRFFTNKFAPASGAIYSKFIRGTDYKGDPMTYLDMGKGILLPITIENLFELSQTEEGATLVGAFIADGLGVATQTRQ